jgi:chromosome segregation ATPase
MTEDRLQVLITRAISDRDNQIQQTLSRLETNDAEAASLLRELTDEIAELRGRGSLLDPDAVSILDSAAHRLGHLQDTTPGLRDAAERLAHLQDTVYLLDNLASRIEQAANRMGEY